MIKTWDDLDCMKLDNVYEQWKMVLKSIKQDDGGEKFVESNCKKFFQAPSWEVEDLNEDLVRRGIDNKGLMANNVGKLDLGLD